MKNIYIVLFITILILSIFIVFYNLNDNKKNLEDNHNRPLTQEVNRIEVYKSKREMLVFNDTILLKTYRIALGNSPIGHKHFEGDGKTPGGFI